MRFGKIQHTLALASTLGLLAQCNHVKDHAAKDKLMSAASILSILDKVDPFWNSDAGPLFSEEQTRALAAQPEAERALLAILSDSGETPAHRFAAFEALGQQGWLDFAGHEADARIAATVLADAIGRDQIHNRWGLPGHFVGRTGKLLLKLGTAVDAALRPLLDDNRPLNIVGSQESTLNLSQKYRIADLAGYLIATRRNIAWPDEKEPSLRDSTIRKLRATVSAPSK